MIIIACLTHHEIVFCCSQQEVIFGKTNDKVMVTTTTGNMNILTTSNVQECERLCVVDFGCIGYNTDSFVCELIYGPYDIKTRKGWKCTEKHAVKIKV